MRSFRRLSTVGRLGRLLGLLAALAAGLPVGPAAPALASGADDPFAAYRILDPETGRALPFVLCSQMGEAEGEPGPAAPGHGHLCLLCPTACGLMAATVPGSAAALFAARRRRSRSHRVSTGPDPAGRAVRLAPIRGPPPRIVDPT